MNEAMIKDLVDRARDKSLKKKSERDELMAYLNKNFNEYVDTITEYPESYTVLMVEWNNIGTRVNEFVVSIPKHYLGDTNAAF